jgi:prevent-host-death family protein
MKAKPASKVGVVAETEFKHLCQALIEQVSRTGERVLITRHGKPVAELVRHHQQRRPKALGCLKGDLFIIGDIISPAYVTGGEDVSDHAVEAPASGNARRGATPRAG